LFTYFAISKHVLKAGFKYKAVELSAKEQQPYNPQYNYNIDYDPLLVQPYSVRWGTPLANVGDGSVESNNAQLGLYFQDDWSATDRLTLNAGLRWDYEKSDAYLDYVTPAAVVAGIANWEGIKNSDININDYISNGHNRNSFKNAWQPRLGFTYDLSDENDIAVFGGVGRAYDRNLFDHLQVERTKATFPTYNVLFKTADPVHLDCNLSSPTSSNCVAFDPQYLTQAGLNQLANNSGVGREVDMIDNNLKTPYSDQLSLGVRGSLTETWHAELSLSHVASKDGFAWMKANRRADGSFFNGADTWGSPGSNFGIPGFGDTLIGVNGMETKSNSLMLKLDKPRGDSSWDMAIAYTYTKAKTNRKDGEHYATDYPSMDDYGMQPSNNLPEHRLVVSTMIDLPAGIDFSAKLNLQSVEHYYGINCRAGWSACEYGVFQPDSAGFLGYKQLDIAFSKNIATDFLSDGSHLIARLDVLNLTNAINYENYNDWYGSPDAADANFAKPQDQLAGPPLTLKFGVTWNW
jgi:TonB dependent receptor